MLVSSVHACLSHAMPSVRSFSEAMSISAENIIVTHDGTKASFYQLDFAHVSAEVLMITDVTRTLYTVNNTGYAARVVDMAAEKFA